MALMGLVTYRSTARSIPKMDARKPESNTIIIVSFVAVKTNSNDCEFIPYPLFLIVAGS